MNPTNQKSSDNIELSIVTTMYRSEQFIGEFYGKAASAAAAITSQYEIIFVNDGSPDGCLERVRMLLDIDDRVRIVDLSRNFGHHRAMMVGLEHAQGKKIFLIDCDLEENPLALPKFFAEMERTKADVVYGVQPSRRGGLIRRVGGAWFWFFFNLISETKITPNIITSRLMTKRYVENLLRFHERELFLGGVFELAGFAQVPLLIEKGVRKDTSYTLAKRFYILVNAVTSFSSKPLVYVFYLGLLISICSFAAMCFLIARKIFSGGYLMGWPSLIVSIWLLGGLTIFCLGVIGIYLSKVFQEVKSRPLSIVRDTYEKTQQ